MLQRGREGEVLVVVHGMSFRNSWPPTKHYAAMGCLHRISGMTSPALDAITLALLWTQLIPIAAEAAVAMVRTSFSINVRESNDYACVLTDARGHSVAQATHSIPSFLNTAPQTIRHF